MVIIPALETHRTRTKKTHMKARKEFFLFASALSLILVLASCDEDDDSRFFGSPCNITCQNGGSVNSSNCTCNCPAGFTGQFCEEAVFACGGMYTDPRDGKTYSTVQIGSQCWFRENLRYAGSLPQITNQNSWNAIWNNGNPTGQAAWCIYDNNSMLYEFHFGYLYTWYAVSSGSICPPGWRVPGMNDWLVLEGFLGSDAGGKMKEVGAGWLNPNTGANNQSGFSARPGGMRGYEFSGIGESTYWWSTYQIPQDSRLALGFYVINSSAGLINAPQAKASGYSCRCIKN